MILSITLGIGFTSLLGNAQNCHLRTQGHGAWGASPKGKNNAQYLHNNFAGAFAGGLVLGCDNGYTLTLTTANAVTDFLPSGGSPKALTTNYIDPARSLRNVFASKVTALELSVGFDNYDPGFAHDNLANAIINTGTFSGWSVQAVLDTAQKVLGGCPSQYSINALKSIISSINESFEDGMPVNANLLNCGNACPPITIEGVVSNDSCGGDCNGSIFTQTSGGVLPYTYFWNTSDNTTDLIDLCLGSYMLTVYDSNGCEGMEEFQVIEGNALSVRGVHTDISCECQDNVDCCDGTAAAIVTGGTPPYNYLWSTGDTTSAIVASPVLSNCYNSGDGQVIATDGQVFRVDTFFSGATLTFINNSITDILNTADDTIYKTERYGTVFSYDFPVSAGNYSIDLHFAEIFYGATGGNLFGGVGSRIFHVIIEGDTVLKSYDIFADVGAETAVIKSFVKSSNDGMLNIQFVGAVNNAKINAICISGGGEGLCMGNYSVTVTDQNGCSKVEEIVIENELCDSVSKRSLLESNFNEQKEIKMSVYPNPVSNVAVLELELFEDDHISIDLIDINGKIIQPLFDRSVSAGKHYRFPIDGSQIKPGFYLVRLWSEIGNNYNVPVIFFR